MALALVLIGLVLLLVGYALIGIVLIVIGLVLFFAVPSIPYGYGYRQRRPPG